MQCSLHSSAAVRKHEELKTHHTGFWGTPFFLCSGLGQARPGPFFLSEKFEEGVPQIWMPRVITYHSL